MATHRRQGLRERVGASAAADVAGHSVRRDYRAESGHCSVQRVRGATHNAKV